jgi:tetratricopeptide (TPR) repeat protein
MSLHQDWIKADEIFTRYMFLEGRSIIKEPSEQELRFAKTTLSKCIKKQGLNTAYLFILGKIAQREARFKKALKYFCNMYDLVMPTLETSIETSKYLIVASTAAREASICGFQLGAFEIAVDMAERASALDPNDYGLHVNRAVAHVLAGRPQRALNILDKFQEQLQGDVPARNIRALIQDILNGKIACPKCAADMESYANE